MFDCYGVVLVVEGSDVAQNRDIRSMADVVVSGITTKLPELEKAIQQPPVIEVISAEAFEAERAFLWSLGIHKVLDLPQVVILYGRGRMIGPVLSGEKLSQSSVSAIPVSYTHLTLPTILLV